MCVRVGEAIGHDVEPAPELLLAAEPGLDPRGRDPFGLTGERQAEHILERGEPVATPGQQGADRGVGQVGR
jgi:hypothetical protein